LKRLKVQNPLSDDALYLTNTQENLMDTVDPKIYVFEGKILLERLSYLKSNASALFDEYEWYQE
jgi:hypothetical protein